MIKRTVGDRSKKKFEDMKEPTGFVNRTDSQFSFNDGLMRFTIQPAVTSFKFYSLGKPFVRNAAETVDITDTEGIWYIYYTSVGVLTASQTPWSFTDGSVSIALLYWDATNNSAIGIGEERHGITMDQSTHEYLHDLYGAKWQSGFTPSVTVDGNGSLDAHAEIQSISQGVYFDEDIEHSEAQQTSYELWYKDGASAAWRKTTTSAAAVAITTTRPDWNEYTGGAWQRTEIDNTKFTLTHLFITNDIDSPNILIMGEAQYNSKGDARDGALTEIQNITAAAMPLAEFSEIATFIIECKDAYTNTYNARLVSTEDGFDFVDFRESPKTGVGGSINHHGNLTGLTEDDHLQYLMTDGTRALAGAWDMNNQIITNINIDSGDINTAVTQTEWDAAYSHISNNGSDHSYIDQSVVSGASPNFAQIKGETKVTKVTWPNPNGYWDLDTQLPILYADAALTITKIVVSLNTAAQEVAGDLKWADDLIAFTNATVINDFDTTNGVRVDDSITAGSVAAGKEAYLQLDSQPHADITWITIAVMWDYD